MRILLLPSSYLPVLGGLQTVAHALALGLIKRGHTVQVVTNRYPRNLPAHNCIEDVSIQRHLFLTPAWRYLRQHRADLFLAGFYYAARTLLHLVSTIRRFRPEVVNIHFPDGQIPFVLWLRYRFRFRLVVSFHGHDIERWFNESGQLVVGANQRELEQLRKLLETADVVTTPSRHLLNRVITVSPSTASKGVVIYNGIDLDRFYKNEQTVGPEPYLLAYGRLNRVKGFDLLINAFESVSRSFPVKLVIAGDGEERPHLYAQIIHSGIQNSVQLLGKVPPQQIVELLERCLLVIVPSRSESFGISALEALAAGKPLLATRVGGLPEFVSDPPNCLVAPTVEALAYGLQTMLGISEVQRAAIGVENRAAAAHFTWRRMVDQYLAVYTGSKATSP